MFKRFTSILLALIMVLGIMPVSVFAEGEEAPTIAQRVSMVGEYAQYFMKSTNQAGDYVGFDCIIEGDEAAVKEAFENNTAPVAGFMIRIEAPEGYEYFDVKEIWVNGNECKDEAYTDLETGEFVFNGDLGWLCYLDDQGNLINEVTKYKVVWEKADGETHTDEFRVGYYFPQVPEDEGDQGGNAYPPESTPVSDQVLTVYYLHNGTYIKEIARANIINGKVEITIPYISNSVIDGDVTQARLAFHISNGYSGEGAGNVTHYMGGFGEDIMDYVNWQDTFASMKKDDPQTTYEDFLGEYYWPIGIMGDVNEKASVIKWNVVRLKNGEIRRYLNGGETFEERLYIQYFDAKNETAVAYEYIDLTVNMEYPVDGASRIGFDQVSFNGVTLTDEEFDSKIGYSSGRNGLTDTFIVEMTEEQLLAHENTADETGTIWARFEFSAPFENITHFYMAKGEDIENIKNVELSQFKAYDASNKPMTSQPLGWFEDGSFEQNMFGENEDERCIAWYDETTGDITYQYFKFAYYMPEGHHEDDGEGGNGGDGGENEGPRRYLPDEFYDYWTESEFVSPENVTVRAHDAIDEYLGVEYNEEGVFVVTVKDIPAEKWQEAYEDLAAGEDGINVYFDITPPQNGITYYTDMQGNGPTYQNLKNRYNEDPSQIEYCEYDGYPLTSSLPVGTVKVEGNKTSVFPTESGGVFFKVIFWKTKEGNVVQQIFPFAVEVADDAKNVKFDNGKTYISEDRIEKDGRITKLSSSYDSKNGVLKYSYIGSKTEDADIANDIRYGYGENDPVYAIQTRISAPEEGYTSNGREVVTLYVHYSSDDFPLRGFYTSFDIEWECEGKETIHETISIEFDAGKLWMDTYWKPVTDQNRIIYRSITNDYDIMSAEEVKNAGVILEVFKEPGYIYTKYDDVSKVDIERIANLGAWVLPPDAVSRNEGESLEDWVERVYENTEYVGIKVGATGVGEYGLDAAEGQNESIFAWNMMDVDSGAAAENIAGFGELMVNGIKVWFTSDAMDRNGHTVIIDWYEEGETKPSVREYIYTRQESLVVEETADAVTEKELEEQYEETGVGVTTPTPLGENWKLTTNHYAQKKENENVNAYYFQLEGDENTPDGDKVIYIPYSFIDENLTYEKAVAQGLQPKLHHYNDDHSEKELIKEFQLTPYGIRFVVSDFSPFVLEWTAEEVIPVAELNGTGYASVAEAVAAAAEGNTVKLVENAAEENILLGSGITLDLNGFELSVSNTVCFGEAQIADNSKEKTGILKAENIVFNPNNSQMPVWTGAGYAFANITHQTFIVGGKATENTFALDLRPSFGSKFTGYLKDDGGTNNNIKIAIRVSWGNEGKYQDFTFSDELIQRVYSVSGKTLRITVSGVKDIDNVTAQVLVISGAEEETNVTNAGRIYNFPIDFPVK